MNYPDPQSVTDTQWRRCEDCGTELAPGTDHGDAECRDVLADRVLNLQQHIRNTNRNYYAETVKLRKELIAEQTWALRLEGALAMHDCALLGDMRRKYRGGTAPLGPGEYHQDVIYPTSAAALAEPNE